MAQIKPFAVFTAVLLGSFISTISADLPNFDGYTSFSYAPNRFNSVSCDSITCQNLEGTNDYTKINDCIEDLPITCGFTVSASRLTEELIVGTSECSDLSSGYFNIALSQELASPFNISLTGKALDDNGVEEIVTSEVNTRFMIGHAELHFDVDETNFNSDIWSVAVNASFSTELATRSCGSTAEQSLTFIDYPFHGDGKTGNFSRSLILDRVPASLMLHPTFDQEQMPDNPDSSIADEWSQSGYSQLFGTGFIDGQAVTGVNISLVITRPALRVLPATTTVAPSTIVETTTIATIVTETTVAETTVVGTTTDVPIVTETTVAETTVVETTIAKTIRPESTVATTTEGRTSIMATTKTQASTIPGLTSPKTRLRSTRITSTSPPLLGFGRITVPEYDAVVPSIYAAGSFMALGVISISLLWG